MTTTLTTTCNYAGDFTTIASMFASVYGAGTTDLTASSTGNTTQAGSTSTTIKLASGETKDFTWHLVTCGGESHVITSYNTSTKVGTISAVAGYTGTWASTPGTAASYTISDTKLVLTIGQSASGSNAWTGISSTLSLGAVTSSATDSITIKGSTPWSGGYPGWPNTTGGTDQAVYITGSAGDLMDITPRYVTIQDLALVTTSSGNCLNILDNNGNVTLNNLWLQTAYNSNGVYALKSAAHGSNHTANNCIIFATSSQTNLRLTNANFNYYGCTFTGGAIAVSGYYGSPLPVGCAFFLQASGLSFNNQTYNYCATDQTSTPAGTWTNGTLNLVATAQFVNTTGDFRPKTGSGLLTLWGSNGSLSTDITGASRPGTNATIGAYESAATIPALKSFTYLVDYSTGDITSMAPAWTGTGSGTGAVVTIVSTITGSLAPGDIIAFKNPNGNAGQGYQDNCVILSFGTYTTVGGTGTLNIDRSYGSAFATTNMQVCAFSRVTGADLTYNQSGFTCPSTAADSTHIVIAAFLQTASVIGHPIQWKTGNTCVCTAYNPSTGIATVAAGPSGAGFNANFGGTPQNGDAYTVYPMALTFNQGLASSGNNEWSLTYYQAGGTGSICWACQTSASSTITWTSVVKWTAPQQLGTINGSGATQPAIINLTTGDTDHTSIVSVQSPCNNLLIQGLQFYIDLDVGGGEDGGACFVGGGANPTTAVKIYQCTCGGYISDDLAHIHPAVLGLGGTGWVFDTCVLYCRGNSYWMEYLLDAATLKFCTVVVTQSAVQTVATGVSSGATTITMNSVTGIVAGTPLLYNRGMVVSDPLGNIPAGTYVQSIAGNVITLSAATTGSVATNATLYFGATNLVANGSVSDPIVATNCAFFGAAIPVSTSSTITSSNNACDVPSAVAGSGFTGGLNFANQFNSAFNVIAGTLDVTPKAGNGLGVGAYDATSTVDIFGTARPSSGTVTAGAVQYASTGPNLATFFALMGVGN